jgi:hypothetical protein
MPFHAPGRRLLVRWTQILCLSSKQSRNNAERTSPRMLQGSFEKQVRGSPPVLPEYEQLTQPNQNFLKETVLTHIRKPLSV